jgi:hypothetical protein
MADRSLLLLWDEVRRKTLLLLEGVTDEQARWAPPGLANTILWHAGHCRVMVEWLVMPALGHQPQAPDGWFDMFSWDSRPARVPPDRWPRLAEVVEQLVAQHRRLRGLLRELSEAELDTEPAGRPGRSARYFITHAIHDEACHSGEIWLLRKMTTAAARRLGRSEHFRHDE